MRPTTGSNLDISPSAFWKTAFCVTDHGTGFQVHDTRRNDSAHFCYASRWINQFVQRVNIRKHRIAQSLSSQRHTDTQIRSRLLSQPQPSPNTLRYSVILALVSALSSVTSTLRYSRPALTLPFSLSLYCRPWKWFGRNTRPCLTVASSKECAQDVSVRGKHRRVCAPQPQVSRVQAESGGLIPALTPQTQRLQALSCCARTKYVLI